MLGIPLLAPSCSAMASDMIVVAPGIPALKRSLVELILAGKFVDQGEFPLLRDLANPHQHCPATWRAKLCFQAADYVQSKEHIRDSQPGNMGAMFLHLATRQCW